MNFQLVINEDLNKSENLPLVLKGLGIEYIQEPIIRPQGIRFYQWIQCVKGTGEFIISNQKFIITEGCGIFIMANTPHSYKGITEQWKVNYVCFDGSACNEILHSLKLDTTDVFKVIDYRIIEQQIYKFYEIYISNNAGIYSEYSCTLYELLVKISRNISCIFSTEIILENNNVALAIQYLEKNYMRQITLDQIAEATNFSKQYLCAVFNKNMKQTIISYLQIIRIANARVFLSRYPNKSVAEIGRLCGFENTSYFCKVFRKIEGVTPQIFREKI